MAPTNEKKVMLALSKWMEPFNTEIWWNQKNEYYPVFHSEGSGRSDIIIKNKNQYYLIECKHAVKDSNIYDAFFQTLNYATNSTNYFINDVKCEISGFVVATEHSISGHLFNDSGEVIRTTTEFSEGRISAIYRGEIPKTEYSMTEEFTRLLWRGIDVFNINCSIGVLLSNKLNNSDLPIPLLLMKNKKQQHIQYLR